MRTTSTRRSTVFTRPPMYSALALLSVLLMCTQGAMVTDMRDDPGGAAAGRLWTPVRDGTTTFTGRPLTWSYGEDDETYELIYRDLSPDEVEEYMAALDGVVDWNANIQYCNGPNGHYSFRGPPVLQAILKERPTVIEALRRRGANFNTACTSINGGTRGPSFSPVAMAIILPHIYTVFGGSESSVPGQASANLERCIEELVRGGADPLFDPITLIPEPWATGVGCTQQPEVLSRIDDAKRASRMYRDWPWVIFWSSRLMASMNHNNDDTPDTLADDVNNED